MSAPVRIPTRRGARASAATSSSSSTTYGTPDSVSSSYSYSPSSSLANPKTAAAPSPLRTSSSPSVDSLLGEEKQRRRTSLMTSALAASEHTVINIGDPDGPPRLITCVRSSQGFDWNQEIFLPSRYDHLISPDLERKRDPVHDIHLSEEELHGIFPQ